MQAINSNNFLMNLPAPQNLCLLLASACPAVAFGALPIVPFPPQMLAPLPEYVDARKATLPQLRALLSADNATAHNAAMALVRAGDEATIQRLVYAIKQGNSRAAEALRDSASPQVVPYLLEDVAHGSMERFDTESLRSFDKVRVAATEIMGAALAGTPGLPAESAAWLKETAFRSGPPLMLVPEKSRVLLDWWEHNGEAVLAGRASEATWLPAERKITPRIFEAWSKKNRTKPPPPPPSPPPVPREPASELPVHVDESFESWAARVIDPKRRDVTWATVDYESGKSVKPDDRDKLALDAPDQPLNRGANQSGSTSQASPSSNSSSTATESEIPSSTPWIIIVAAMGLLWVLVMNNRK